MGENETNLIPAPDAELVADSGVPALLDQIRPTWKAKSLIKRVQRLITVDPSSACQRLLNASIHDLREKVAIAGIDIAKETAKQNKLPPIESIDDLENYSTSRIIELAYKMGLLSRPEWRRVSRCYEIRRDLEHEDDEYEAGVEDCVYIFKTCIEVILARDPVHLLKVSDVKDIVEKSEPVTASEDLVNDYSSAPRPRQVEINKFLMSIALDRENADIVQQNAFSLLTFLTPTTQQQVKLEVAEHFQGKLGRSRLETRHIRVAIASGTLPYLRQSQLNDFYRDVLAQMNQVGSDWTAYNQHGELLRSFREVGGLLYCQGDTRREILFWLIKTYVGTPGGMTRYGTVRNVFYSNTAAPIIEKLIAESRDIIRDDIRDLQSEKELKQCLSTKHIARRMERLLDIADASD